MIDKRVFSYRIDADDRLTRVNEPWLAFARENIRAWVAAKNV